MKKILVLLVLAIVGYFAPAPAPTGASFSLLVSTQNKQISSKIAAPKAELGASEAMDKTLDLFQKNPREFKDHLLENLSVVEKNIASERLMQLDVVFTNDDLRIDFFKELLNKKDSRQRDPHLGDGTVPLSIFQLFAFEKMSMQINLMSENEKMRINDTLLEVIKQSPHISHIIESLSLLKMNSYYALNEEIALLQKTRNKDELNFIMPILKDRGII